MPRIEDQHKQEIKQQIWLKIQQNQGIRTAEIADQLKLDRRRVQNYLAELRDEGKIEQEGWGWLSLEFRGPRLYRFELSPEEVITLYLGARLLVKQHDQRNEPAETALRKLATVLRSDAPIGQEIERAADELAQREEDHEYQSIFRKVAQAYAYRKKLKLAYKPPGSNPFPTTFSVYLIEPSLVGAATYIIGHSSNVDAVREYKMGRIQSAELTDENYTIPPEYQGLEVMRHAWSVIGGEAKIEVVLRFSPTVAERVQETKWHPLEETGPDPDKPGWLRWQVKVPSTLDMLPWIRGWGADCEVVGPRKLRKQLRKETKRLVSLYLPQRAMPKPKHFNLWAKANKDTGETHPLIYHLLDVAQVALAMWNNTLPMSTREYFSDALGLSPDETGKLLAFWIGLHDLGKASPGFQRKYEPAIAGLKMAGFTFPDQMGVKAAPHGYVSAKELEHLLISEMKVSKRTAKRVARAVGGHHGTWPTPGELQSITRRDLGNEIWDETRSELVRELKRVLLPPDQAHLPSDESAENALLTLFSGLTSVADWIGSMDEYFEYDEEFIPLEQYAHYAAEKALAALHTLGWLGWQPTGEKLTFDQMFPGFTPRPIQASVISAAEELAPPTLLILEAPTGIGKTEAALYLADRWLQTAQGRGLYIAMPTQATSNQMFGRTADFLKNRYPDNLLNLHLAHGQARWSQDMQDIKLSAIGETEGGRIAAMTWFLPRKRTLLAPFAVGTVDQALMSVLQTRHFFVRLFGLGHKVVIFDEVHAYDTYMSTLFQRLLAWLHAIGVSVIILSATLPEATRQELTTAYLGKQATLPGAAYPRLIYTDSNSQVRSVSLPSPPERKLHIQWIAHAPETIAAKLDEMLTAGGCAAVICNTVARAQEMYQAIKDASLVPADDLILFHARFPYTWRIEIEENVLGRFSKGGERKKSIVVATQVIEQSLDLDFDLMVTDIAPIDLILQRAGRLHRHEQNDSRRPAGLLQPQLLLTISGQENDVPDFGSDAYVYDAYTLLATYLALQERDHILVPKDTNPLIEFVYGPHLPKCTDAALQTRVEKTHHEMLAEREKESFIAHARLVHLPSDEDSLSQSNQGLKEEDPGIHKAFQAMTRLIEPGVSLVCLHKVGGNVYLTLEGTGAAINLENEPDRSEIEKLLQHTITIRRRDIVHHFLEQGAHSAWKKVSALRHHFVVIFSGGVCHLAGTPYALHLNRETGLYQEIL